jgi:hypothetical protein
MHGLTETLRTTEVTRFSLLFTDTHDYLSGYLPTHRHNIAFYVIVGVKELECIYTCGGAYISFDVSIFRPAADKFLPESDGDSYLCSVMQTIHRPSTDLIFN